MLLSAFSFQTISFVYIVTAIVGVEAWYEPFLFNFLYRDLFTAMIIGKKLHVEAYFNITLLLKPVFDYNKLYHLFPSPKPSSKAEQPYSPGFNQTSKENEVSLFWFFCLALSCYF